MSIEEIADIIKDFTWKDYAAVAVVVSSLAIASLILERHEIPRQVKQQRRREPDFIPELHGVRTRFELPSQPHLLVEG
jgi:hypothetical protein